MAEFSIPENMKTMFENLEKLFTSKTVFGDAVTFGETTLIPVMEISFGIGSGGGAGDVKKMSGGGSGVGARMSPVAVIAVTGEQVEILTIKKTAGLDCLTDIIPDIIGKFKGRKKEDSREA